jgi:hypothetical protein
VRRLIEGLFDAIYPRQRWGPDRTPFYQKVLFLLLLAGLAAFCVLRY